MYQYHVLLNKCQSSAWTVAAKCSRRIARFALKIESIFSVAPEKRDRSTSFSASPCMSCCLSANMKQTWCVTLTYARPSDYRSRLASRMARFRWRERQQDVQLRCGAAPTWRIARCTKLIPKRASRLPGSWLLDEWMKHLTRHSFSAHASYTSAMRYYKVPVTSLVPVGLYCRALTKGNKCISANFLEIAKNINQPCSPSTKLTCVSKYAIEM